MRENCSHGVRMRGTPPPRCIECEIVWEAEALITAEQAVARHSIRLARLCEEAGRPVPRDLSAGSDSKDSEDGERG